MLNESNIPLEEDGIEEEILVDEEVAITKAMWGDVGGNIENQTDLQNALDAKQDSLTEAQLNAVNSGITSEKVTTYDGYADQIASKADQSALNAESTARGEADTALGTRIDNEVLARQQADNGLQSQIDAITSKSDVVDVVANYAALQAYDTSTLGNNDVVKVLDDETHEDALTYYRWSTTTQTWTYIGQEAPYYSKGQMDVKLAEKQDKLTAGANIQIQNGTISATDTKYTNGNGLNLNGTEFSADTDVLATKEDLEGYYTKPETDTKLAPKLEAEVVAELPTTGAEGKLYLTPKAHTTSTATGNPIEATVTEQAGQLESFQLDGDTFQQSYSGKNLVNLTDLTAIGVTGHNNGDGTVTISGTATGSSSVAIMNASREIEAGTYTLTISKALPFTINLSYRGVSFRIAAGSTSVTTTATSSFSSGNLWVVLIGNTTYNETFGIQLTQGSTADYDFEPYVGGQPSPSPDYPQQIQTVTGEQTVEIHGKNLLRYPYTGGTVGTGLTWTVADDGTIHVVGTIGGGNKSYYLYNRSQSDFDMPEIPAGTYKVFWSIAGSGSSPRITIQDANGYHNSNASNEVAIATSAKPTNIYIQFTGSQSGGVDLYIKPMIVPSDQADVYAPYSHQTLPLDLGSLELCKLGTYQDYIYKDGDEWKVHKNCKTITLNGSEDWQYSSTYDFFYAGAISGMEIPVNAGVACYCRTHNGLTSSNSGPDFATEASNYTYAADVHTTQALVRIKDTRFSSTQDFANWLTQNNTTIYYVVKSATDTAITDQTLIAQLEAIRTASLENGTNTITNTATGTNLAGDMEIGYFGFNPTNRYDKFIWLDLNNNYEQIGS